MDNLCHTLAGAALAQAGLKNRTALGMGTLMIASNIPDLDVAVFATDTLAMSFRRGWTHGVLAMVVLPTLLAAALLLWDRTRRRRLSGTARAPATFGGSLLLACIGTWLHVLMDFLNSYGVRLLMPFSSRWFYGDALYIVDPWLYVFFGAGIFLSWRRGRRQQASAPGPARVALVLAFAYMALMLASNVWARAEVQRGLSRAGRPASTRFMVTPVFANPLRREVIVDTGDRYEKGALWFAPAPHFRPVGYGVDVNRDDPAARQAAETPRVRAYLSWSRFPFFVVQHTANGRAVYLNDYRYSGPSAREGWSAIEVAIP